MSKSHVSATIPWQEGTEEDFKDLREQLEKLRSLAPEYLGDSSDGEDDSSDDEDVEPGAVRGILRKNIDILDVQANVYILMSKLLSQLSDENM